MSAGEPGRAAPAAGGDIVGVSFYGTVGFRTDASIVRKVCLRLTCAAGWGVESRLDAEGPEGRREGAPESREHFLGSGLC